MEVGLSDHTISNLAATVAIGLGASAIEKHFKPSEDTIGPDSSFSINPDHFSSLVQDCCNAWSSLGKKGFHRSIIESGSRRYRRSIYFVNNLKKGKIIGENDVKAIRPGFGLPPKYLDLIIGKKVKSDVERGDPVTFEIISDRLES